MADSVHMSASSFHQRFKAATTMSPRQYQKVLRLHEARRLMLFQKMEASDAVPPRRPPECFAVQRGVRTLLRECPDQRYRPEAVPPGEGAWVNEAAVACDGPPHSGDAQ
jgi:AraC-like DNA-binding protein